MRSEGRAAAAALVALAVACREAAPPQEATAERFAGVPKRAAPAAAAATAFCERTYAPGGEGARRWTLPPLRELAGAATAGARPARAGWTWVNLWATWCEPCIEELPLLGRWREGFSRDGVPVAFELLSIDEPEQEAALAAWRSKGLPGQLRWLRSAEDLGPLLDALGVERGAMIPIHAIVDAEGWVRCVRVGAVHEQDYAAVKALVAG